MVKESKITVRRDENFRDIIVNGILGGSRPGFIEVLLYTDELVGDEALRSTPIDVSKVSVLRTIKCRLVMDPFQAKMMANWFNHHVAQYEKIFGKIAVPEEAKEKRTEKGKGTSLK